MEVQEEVLDEQIAEEEQVESAPEEEEQETEPDKTLEDEIQLMSPTELKDFATRMLLDKREGNAEAVKAKKSERKAQDDLAAIKTEQARVKREAELAAMEDSEAMKAKLADSQAEVADERGKRQKAEVGNAIMSAATRLKFIDPADAAKNISIESVMIEGRLDHDAVEDQVAALAVAKPHYVQTKTKRSTILDAPVGDKTENAGPEAQQIADRLTTPKAKALGAAQKRFQDAQRKPGEDAALETAIAYRKLTELDSKIATGEYMEESLKETARRRRED